MIDPPIEQIKNSYWLLKVIKSLKPGTAMNQLYEKASETINSTRPEMLKYVVKNCGYGIKSNLIVSPNNSRPIEEGMWVLKSLKCDTSDNNDNKTNQMLWNQQYQHQ